MNVDPTSLAIGVAMSAAVACAWLAGRQGAIRECRRVVSSRGNLDRVFFEDAERDPLTHADHKAAPPVIANRGNAATAFGSEQ